MTTQAEADVKRLSQLRALRRPYESVWRECFDYTFPLRGHGFDGSYQDAYTGSAKQARILDSTATESVRMLASNVQGGMTPANALWFGLVVQDANEEEKRWLADAAETIWRHVHESNFDAESFDALIDGIVAGWFALFVDEDRDAGGYRFETWPIGQCQVAASKPGGLIDTIYREFQLTATQVVAEYEGASQKVREMAGDPARCDKMVRLLHVIEPRAIRMVGGKLARNLPFASRTIECETKTLVRDSGYHEFPVIVPRWNRLPSSVYAVGPVHQALPDIRQLNTTRAMETQAQDLAIAGMWIAEDDGVLNPKTIKVGPRKVIVANSVDSMKPLLTGSDFKVAWTSEERLQAAVRKTLMADQLQPQDGPAMTATEVHVRVALIRQLLGPVYGRQQAEFLAPLIYRCFGLAMRGGALGIPPQSLTNRDYHVKYEGPMARAQKLEEVSSIERLGASTAALAQAKPEVLDLIDGDEAVRVMADGLGVPSKVILDARRVKMKREERAKQQQAAQQQAQAQQAQAAMTDAAAQRVANAV